MAYCVNCGQQLPAGAKFCMQCGSAAAVHQDASMMKQCPGCGYPIHSGMHKCPGCGCELREISASTSVRDFAEKLQTAESEQQRIILIRSFPIPSAKADIQDFLVLSSSNAMRETRQDVVDAWMTKLDQCAQKAELTLGSSDAMQIRQACEQHQKSIAKQWKRIAREKRNAQRKVRPATGERRKQAPQTGWIDFIFGHKSLLLGLALLGVACIGYGQSWAEDLELFSILVLWGSALTLGIRRCGRLDYVLACLSGALAFAAAAYFDDVDFQVAGFLVLLSVFVNYVLVKIIKFVWRWFKGG